MRGSSNKYQDKPTEREETRGTSLMKWKTNSSSSLKQHRSLQGLLHVQCGNCRGFGQPHKTLSNRTKNLQNPNAFLHITNTLNTGFQYSTHILKNSCRCIFFLQRLQKSRTPSNPINRLLISHQLCWNTFRKYLSLYFPENGAIWKSHIFPPKIKSIEMLLP